MEKGTKKPVKKVPKEAPKKELACELEVRIIELVGVSDDTKNVLIDILHKIEKEPKVITKIVDPKPVRSDKIKFRLGENGYEVVK